MNARIKSGMKYIMAFLVGVIVGAFLLESLEIHVRPVYRDLMATQLKTEQDYMASRAARENKLFAAAFHRWVAANAGSEDGFPIFRTRNSDANDDSYFLPFALFVLNKDRIA